MQKFVLIPPQENASFKNYTFFSIQISCSWLFAGVKPIKIQGVNNENLNLDYKGFCLVYGAGKVRANFFGNFFLGKFRRQKISRKNVYVQPLTFEQLMLDG